MLVTNTTRGKNKPNKAPLATQPCLQLALTRKPKPTSMKIYVKNMVCSRCITVVKNELAAAGILPIAVVLGEIELAAPPTTAQLTEIEMRLTGHGFERIDDKKSILVESIKKLALLFAQNLEDQNGHKFSVYIAKELGKNYSYLSNIFSEVEGVTLEHFIILQKIEKVKELLVYNEQSLSQIAYTLGYSSVAHVSAQFKKVTGLTPSHFKTIGTQKRASIDALLKGDS